MKQTTPTPEYFGSYKDSFRSRAHEILGWGYSDALSKIQSQERRNQKETAITGFIVDAIKHRLRLGNRPSWLRYFSIQDDSPQETLEKTGSERPRVDIVIEGSGILYRPEYMFEAKRLGKRKDIKIYLGPDGIKCLLDGRYARRYDEAAMLGYVQSDSLEDWKERITKQIENCASDLFLNLSPKDVHFDKSFPLEWASEHNRVAFGRPIRVLHILLDCIPQTIDPL